MVTPATCESVGRADGRSRGVNPAARDGDATLQRHFLNRGHGVEFEMEVDWVRAQLPPGAERVADLGCGIGALFPVIGPHRVLGVDSVAEGLSFTQRRYPSIPLACAVAERLPLADASLDAITLQHVAEHIPAFDQACREWLRVLRPGGALLLLTPNAGFGKLDLFDDPTHIHLFHAADLAARLRAVGFQIVDLRTIGLPWFRRYHGVPAGWRLRRFVTEHARGLSAVAPLRWKGQTLCCAARRPED